MSWHSIVPLRRDRLGIRVLPVVLGGALVGCGFPVLLPPGPPSPPEDEEPADGDREQ